MMFRNYLKIAFRNIKRNKTYSAINIIGLTIGFASTILILLWVSNELSYNKFNNNIDKIFVVPQTQEFQATGKITSIATPPALAAALKNERPEIEYAARYISFLGASQVSYNNKNIHQLLNMADPDFLRMFSFDFIKGDKNTALNDPHSVVITQKAAQVYFGNEEPLGKTLRFRDKIDLKVTGVIKDLPLNSDIAFDMIAPSEVLKELGYDLNNWGMNMLTTFVQLYNPVKAPELSKMIAERMKKEMDAPTVGTIFLFPFKDYHLYSFSFSGAGEKIETVIVFVIIAIMILLVACINYINLSTARSAKRSVEVGIKKVVGISRSKIMLQFFGESLLMIFISLLLSLYLVVSVLPVFSNITGKELSLSQISPIAILLIIGIAFFTGIISGIYPALVLSSFKPISTLKRSVSGIQSKYSLRRILVIFQFAVSILLIIGTAVIYSQVQYIQNKDIGLDKNNIIYINLSETLQKNTKSLKTELLRNPKIKNVTVSSGIPTDIFVNNGGWGWEGKNPEQEERISIISADEDFLKTYGIKLLSGRFYSNEFSGDNSSSIVINECFAKLLGFNNPLGKSLSCWNQSYTIIGVVKDFNFASLKKKIEPLVINTNPYPAFLSIKAANAGLNETIDHIKNVCLDFDPRFVFEYEFLDNAYKKVYDSEYKLSKILNTFAFLAILISCLGLFGLTSFITELKIKEVAIRKVLGASTENVLLLLTRKFITWVLIANLFSWPVAYYFMSRWLEGFAYRTEISWWMFTLAGGIALVIALVTVSFQAIKAATANPIESLKYE